MKGPFPPIAFHIGLPGTLRGERRNVEERKGEMLRKGKGKW